MTPPSPSPITELPRKIRLGIVQRVLTPYRVPFFERLAATSGFDVAILAGQPMTGETIKTTEAVERVRRDTARNRYWLNSGNMIVWQSNVRQWLREFDPDVLVVEANPRILSHWQAIWWMHHRGRPVLGWGLGELERTGPGLSLAVRRLAAKKLVQAFDGLIAYSTKAKGDYVAAGVPADRVFVAHNSIDNSESERYLVQLSDFRWIPSWRAENLLDLHLPVVLFVGRLIAGKQIDLLIRACAPLFDRCQLLIVGDGSAHNELERLALPYGGRVRFAGHQTGEALARSFIASDIFVLPAAGGLALHQAMSYGKPVIASFGDGTEADLIRDGENGYIFRQGAVADLTDRIAALLSDSQQMRRMGQASLEIVRNEINLDRMAASFTRAVKETLVRS